MALDESRPITQREQTDQSLRVERAQVDDVLADTQTTDEQKADQAVRRARDNSDAVLIAARERADQRMELVVAQNAASSVTLIEERLVEDQRVQRARDSADAALSFAREKADQRLEHAASQAAVSSATIAAERLLEDRIRRNERAFADGTLRRERNDSARVLSKLLPLERQRTDRDLLTERTRSDAAVSSRDDFMAMVSHDLRSLLGGIVMCTELIAADVPYTEQGRVTLRDTDNIQRYAARMNRLIGDLVDVVSIDAGKLSVIRAPCDATALVSEVVDTFLETARDKGIALHAELPAESLLTELDRERILQVLANLITNSIKFSERGGSICVQVERADELLRFSVRDGGSGIPTDMLEAIFQRFWQAGKDDRRGLGLGLYISRCIVEAHGGRIWAENQPGGGSRFSFTIAGEAGTEPEPEPESVAEHDAP